MYTKKVYNTCWGVFTVYKVRMYTWEYTDYDVHSLVLYTKSVYSVHIFHWIVKVKCTTSFSEEWLVKKACSVQKREEKKHDWK